ncbi:ABC transporter ATP-binding protein [Bacillus canaveralius]|uniref:ABC transporter ATP-binding protein n=1 Tax=Bacillus canaveralius TaxID=1403243 RepID=A0A2N5GSV7_9BACI|nr:ABC transporter ATP-binding protein [Bacillus canaveralius]PLR86855.1 ABC transporter ATP-binding protein [Bacillus canaveralius]PLR93343.1 ABC transporter ATP-binding protein [Bacillus canaveralius]
MFKMWAFLKPYRIPVAIALLLMLTELAVELVQPLLIAKIIDEGILRENLPVVMFWGAVMVAFSIIAFAAGVTNSFYASHVSQSFGYDVRESLFNKVQSFSFANFNRFPAASLVTRMTNDVTQIQNTVFMSLRIALRAPLLVIGGVMMAFAVNVKLALILAIALPILFVFLLWLMKKGRSLFKSVQSKLDGVNNVMRENLVGMRLIKAFLRRGHEGNRFKKANQDLMEWTVSALRMMEMAIPVLLFVMNLSIIAVLWFGTVDVSTGKMQVGEVVAIVNYATRITGAFSMFSWIMMAFSRAQASAERMSEVLETEIDLYDSEHLDPSIIVEEGKLKFDHVSFQYPESCIPILDDVSFRVKKGETVAILGATGAGKSSLFQLIPRLYDVTSGAIYIDDHDITMMKLDHLRRKIGFVPQEALLFTGTVKDNIAWGKEDATIKEIIEAAKSAQIHETINKLPKKYDTIVGQKGVNLSGGQKQRIAIARALVRKPRILLLDDSTSALDLVTEAKLLEAIKKYPCTTLIITQKISTAMEADHIILLEEGKLLEKGSHASLLKHSSLYRSIFQSQYGEETLQHVQGVN